MNIKDGDAGHESIAAAPISVRERRVVPSDARNGQGVRRTDRWPGQPARRFPDQGGEAAAGGARAAGNLGPSSIRRIRASVLIHRRRSGDLGGRGALCPRRRRRRSCAQDLACWQQAASGRRSSAADRGRARPICAGRSRPSRTWPSSTSIGRRRWPRSRPTPDRRGCGSTRRRARSTGCAAARTATASR